MKNVKIFNYLVLPFNLFLILCKAQNLNDDEIIKQSLRPLKYFKACKKFCENVTCQPVKDCNDGVVLKNESYCKCCEACVKLLDIGEFCTEIIEGSLALGAQSRCKQGTICRDGKCELNTEDKSCLLDRDIRKEHRKTGNYANDIWVPQCDKEGNYAAKQKKTTKSFCVDKSGKKIFGTADDSLENTCTCSRLVQEKSRKDPIFFYVKSHEHCSPSGSFDTLQCINNLCYCADNNTGEIKSELVRLEFLHNLPCYERMNHRIRYLKDCEIELQRSKKLAYEFWKKGVQIFNTDRIKCDPDGTFSPKQCLPNRCVCTDEEGIGIGEYFAELGILTANMTCNCARDSSPFTSSSCEKNGNYKSFTCLEDKCVCSDEDGEIVSKDLEDSEENYCKEIIENLSEYPFKKGSSDSDYEYD